MRTSNKILLSVFLAAVLILAGIHIALYAKLKQGDFIPAKEMWKLDFTRHELSRVKYILAKGMDNITIIPSDTCWLEIEKNNSYHFPSSIRYQVKGDSLIMSGDTTITRNDGSSQVQKSWTNVNIYLPYGASIKGDNSEFTIKGSTDSSKALSFDITLDHEGKVHFAENEWKDSSSRFFKIVNLRADHSSGIELAKYAVVDEMNLVLTTSSFEDKNAVINTGSIQADQKSTLALNGGNLRILDHRKEP
ncbi:MAG: hypothetical protein ACHQEM_05705 [Chitinophagales bacterium]